MFAACSSLQISSRVVQGLLANIKASAIFEVALLRGISGVSTSEGSRAPTGTLTPVLNRSRRVEFGEIES